ncbi:aldo/keto reductase [Spongiactinospora sp. TRM90649]|uniref:aldo/keto reductase n=1 Tax=Spongiactinospora sp. TRM90649 TaxID=3031114 RepID=UPI0023F72721|nr:aldo/keto reductase [Spongiactinospora sp. TRM90649]MDF5758956.1 aldo/keto reductase [Spongiactinospora sp. TRM90649]
MSTKIPTRRIGTHGPVCSVLSMGSWHIYDRMDFTDAVAMIRYAVDRGVNLFDVAVYGFEGYPKAYTDVLFSAIVRAAGIARHEYLLSVKLWLEDYPEISLRAQLENALFRAGTDRADIAVLGDVRLSRGRISHIAEEMAALEAEGLIGCWGVNEWPATSIREVRALSQAAGSKGPQVAQFMYSPCRRSVAEGEPYRELFASGITLQASSALEGGILAGRLTPTRPIGNDPGDVRADVMEAYEGIAVVAGRLKTTPARLCIAYSMTHPNISSVLFGTSKMEQLLDNMGAIELLEKLGAEEIREALSPFWVDREAVDPEG